MRFWVCSVSDEVFDVFVEPVVCGVCSIMLGVDGWVGGQGV